jgi:hypothetical protein
VAFSIALGYVITSNLVLHVEGIVHWVTTCAHEDSAGSDTPSDIECLHVGIGPGVAYYFMPSTLYVSGSILVFQEVSEIASKPAHYSKILTDSGFGFALMVGKEWWISRRGAVGLAAEYYFGAAKANGPGPDSRWTSHAVAAMVSFTF